MTEKMTEFVQWDSIPTTSSGGDGEKNDYLRFESGKSYRIRPIFSPVKFFKYFHKHDGRLRTAICGSPDTCPVRDRHSELKKPSLRFAAYVIDRSDGKVKILEAPQTVFRPIGKSLEITGKNPGSGKDGSDWSVTVSGKGLNTKYDVVFCANTPLTEEEREAIKESLDGDKDKLKKLYKTDAPEQIEEKLFGEWQKKESSTPSEPVAATAASAPASTPASAPVDSKSSGKDDFANNW